MNYTITKRGRTVAVCSSERETYRRIKSSSGRGVLAALYEQGYDVQPVPPALGMIYKKR